MPRRRRNPRATGDAGIAHGFRSGLEAANAKHLREHGQPVLFETLKIPYVKPSTLHVYSADFELKNGIVVETKGIFELEDRKKHLLVKSQHPDLDLRFVFTRPQAPIYKGSPTTYADWCDRHGFKYAARLIPVSWMNEEGTGKPILTPKNKLPFQDRLEEVKPPKPQPKKAAKKHGKRPQLSRSRVTRKAGTKRRSNRR